MVHLEQICVLVLSLLLGVRTVCSIQCFSCTSRENLDCLRPRKGLIPLTNCSISELENTQRYAEDVNQSFNKIFHLDIQNHEPQVPLNCLKLSIRVGDENVVVRGCQLAATENMSVCGKIAKLGKDHVKMTHCSLCNRDGCNSARTTNPTFTIIYAFSVVFVTIKAFS